MELLAETFKEYSKRLSSMGLKELGEGAFGKVFQHPADRDIAVKIVRRDDANRRWLKFCQSHQDNPFLPKLYGVNTLDVEDSKYAYAVFMEKLKPAPLYKFVSFSEDIADSLRKEGHPVSPKSFWKDCANFSKDNNLKEVATFFAKALGRLDISMHNVMLRGKQIVFVDPLA